MIFKIEGNILEEKDWLRRIASWPDMSLFNSFKILVGILLGPPILCWFKIEKMLENSALTVGVIFYLRVEGNQMIFLGKSGGRLNIYSNFNKIIIESISHIR